MANHWLFVAFIVAAVSVIGGGHPVAGSLLLAVIFSRVLALRHRHTLVIGLVVMVAFGGLLVWRQQDTQRRQVSMFQPTAVTLTVNFQPDELVFRGASYYFIGKNAQSGEALTVSGWARSAAELRQLKQLRRAQTWQIKGQQIGIMTATNFNQFDAARYWANRGVTKSVKVDQVLQRRHQKVAIGHWVSQWWHRQRTSLIRYCDRLPGALRVYALGLLPGVRAAEATQELQGMRQLGLLHLFSISGLHVALILTVVEWLCVQLRLQREHWEWGLLLGLPGYFILAGGGSGVLRACLMRGIQLGGRKVAVTISTLDAWSGALLVGLWLNPGMLFELGSQLSYGLSLGLVLLARESRAWRQLGLTLLGLPSLLNGIFQWHLLTVLANVVLVPLFPIVLLPLTLIGVVSWPWVPMVGQWCAGLLGGLDAMLNRLAELPGNVSFGKPWWWACWLWVALSWWLFSRPVRQRRHWLIGLLVSYGVMYGLIHLPIHGEVAYFDVGQGDSILLREPFNRRIAMIDTGGRLAFPQPRWVPPTPTTYGASRTSLNYLRSLGIDHVDDLYLTHHDADHIGDLPAFLHELRVKRLLVPAGMEREPGWRHLLADSRYPVAVQSIQVGSAVPLVVRHPYEAAPAENANSLALQGDFGGLNFLFMGDLDQAGEQKIIAEHPQLRTDVLKLGHHGSKTASAPAFIEQLRPRWAIISAGRRNRYGHPHAETLATLRSTQVPAVSTQTSGMIRYVYTGTHGFWQTKIKGAQDS
ncbi:DNA internalization-related competence protein ComEC/Rec2 [Levilactobacillus tujiorum]|uniref:DNA internalization-related competence protein ComEC/Rec2 n=1 Tax=Levilactobacillus tujiorum TaxID=2912243 RepID=UPI001F112AAA|nr:DNA internalization-related competence protein ComEC/Rec2 [Levilactobacillus tujiorum]